MSWKIVQISQAQGKREDRDSKEVMSAILAVNQHTEMIRVILKEVAESTHSDEQLKALLFSVREMSSDILETIWNIEFERKL